jgi:hypothetical protein
VFCRRFEGEPAGAISLDEDHGDRWALRHKRRGKPGRHPPRLLPGGFMRDTSREDRYRAAVDDFPDPSRDKSGTPPSPVPDDPFDSGNPRAWIRTSVSYRDHGPRVRSFARERGGESFVPSSHRRDDRPSPRETTAGERGVRIKLHVARQASQQPRGPRRPRRAPCPKS